MTTPTKKLYLCVTIEKNGLDQRLEKKLNDVNSFNNLVILIKEMIAYFKGKNYKTKKKYKNYQTTNKILESVNTIIITGATSTSITLSNTGIALIILRISAGIACVLSLKYKLLQRMKLNKYNKYKRNNIKKINKLLNLFLNFTEKFLRYFI